MAVAALALVAVHQPAGAIAEPPSPASGHAEVIAGGVVTFGDGPFHWQPVTIAVTSQPTPVDPASPTFVIATAPVPVMLDDATGTLARLSAGEALFRPALATTALHTPSPTGAGALAIPIVAGPGDADGTFTPGSSTRDVDLVADTLAAGETLTLHADVAALLVVSTGTVNAASTANAAGTAVAAGRSFPLSGDVTLTNTAAETASVLVAVVGPAVTGNG